MRDIAVQECYWLHRSGASQAALAGTHHYNLAVQSVNPTTLQTKPDGFSALTPLGAITLSKVITKCCVQNMQCKVVLTLFQEIIFLLLNWVSFPLKITLSNTRMGWFLCPVYSGVLGPILFFLLAQCAYRDDLHLPNYGYLPTCFSFIR